MAVEKMELTVSVRLARWVRPLIWCACQAAMLRLVSVEQVERLARWAGEKGTIIKHPNGKRLRP